MAELLASGRLVDFILVLVVFEIVAIGIYWLATGRGLPIIDLLSNILAGAFLLLALRFALANAGWMSICGCLAAAGIAHVIDLSRRWPG